MLYILFILFFLILLYGPEVWVNYIIRKYNNHLEKMPGTGSELALNLIEKYSLKDVTIKKTEKDEDYYDPNNKTVGLSPDVYDGKSLSAVAIAAHEVGHAIQHANNESVSKLRDKYVPIASLIQNIGIFILFCTPIAGFITKAPILMLSIGVITMLAAVVINAMVLPAEFDASFAKALPILKDNYIPDEYIPAVRQVLKACALTYVASALADILSIWRWMAILR